MKNHPKNTGIKRSIIVWMCLMLPILVRASDEEYRTFRDSQGRSFEGRLLDYKAATETVVLKRSDAISGSVQLDRFSEEDRIHILDWAAARRFREDLELVPALKSSSVPKEESGIYDFNKKVFDVFYEIRFMNRSDAPLDKLGFEYCIFYNQGERKKRNVIHYEEGSCYGEGVVERLLPAGEHMSETKSIRLFTEGGGVTLFGSDVVSIANVRGIWIRLKTKLPSGTEIMREYRTSDDELWKWAPCSFGAGMNEGAKEQTFFFTK